MDDEEGQSLNLREIKDPDLLEEGGSYLNESDDEESIEEEAINVLERVSLGVGSNNSGNKSRRERIQVD